jgi:hypothetical protein
MFDKIKNLFKSKPGDTPITAPVASDQPKKQRKPRVKKTEQQMTAKQLATQNGEPYISILKVDVDPSNINSGSFELDWNDKFVLNLVRAGYKIREDDTDNDIVDRWFQTVCRNIALEVYEQKEADLTTRPKSANSDIRHVQRKDIGNNRSEIS